MHYRVLKAEGRIGGTHVLLPLKCFGSDDCAGGFPFKKKRCQMEFSALRFPAVYALVDLGPQMRCYKACG